MAFSSTYSRILARTRGGNCRTSMRSMIFAERPVLLWLAFRMVQVVLRPSPSARACASSVKKPSEISASAISRILADCRAFISREEHELVRLIIGWKLNAGLAVVIASAFDPLLQSDTARTRK